MKFQIPFTLASPERIKKRVQTVPALIRPSRKSKLGEYLAHADVPLTREEYLALIFKTCIIAFIAVFVLTSTLMLFLGIGRWYLYSAGFALVCAIFVASTQLLYPKLFVSRRDREIEKNLIPALEDMLVQLNAGIPLFTILVNLSNADYGELSEEFKRAVKKISAGKPQIEVLEELGKRSSSLYFKRTLWQISNGMKAGSDITIVIRDSITALNEEQLLQIQNYGNKLNPMIMFYMLISVILPALSITFLTIISSIVNLSASVSSALYIGLFVGVCLIQIMFIGMIRSIRPSLL